MISLMKQLTRSFLGKIVLMIVVVGMALWGVDAIFAQVRGGLGANIAAAGARAVTPEQLDIRVEAVIRNINATSDQPISKSEALENGLIDQIIEVEKARIVRLGFGESIGISPSTQAVLEEMNAIAAFQNPLTGELDPAMFRDRLQQLRMTPVQFERQLEDDIIIQALSDAGMSAVFGPRALANLQARYLAETREIRWFFYDTDEAPPPPPPTDEEIRTYYDQNIERLRQPERRALDILRLSIDDFTGKVEISDQEVATIYEATKSERFAGPDQRTYAELLFSSRDAARNAFGLLAGGADPNSVPGASSVQLRTARAEEVADANLRDAMFGPGRQSGAMYGPREVNGSWLVARLISVQPGAVKPLEEVAEQIRMDLARERAQLLFANAMEALDDALAAGEDLNRIAAGIGVPVISIAPVDQNGRTEFGDQFALLADVPGALPQAFRLPENEISSRFDVSGAVVLITPRRIVEASTPEFAAAREDVRQLIAAERRANAAEMAVTSMTDRIRSGEISFERAAAEARSEVETLPEPVSRMNAQSMGMPGPLLQATFGNQAGDVLGLPTGDSGLFVILQVVSVTPPGPDVLAGLGASATAEITNALSADLEQALDGELQRAMRLRDNPTAIAAYKRTITTAQ